MFWQVNTYNEYGETVEIRKALTPEQLQKVVESLAHEKPRCYFDAFPEGQYPDDLELPLFEVK